MKTQQENANGLSTEQSRYFSTLASDLGKMNRRAASYPIWYLAWSIEMRSRLGASSAFKRFFGGNQSISPDQFIKQYIEKNESKAINTYIGYCMQHKILRHMGGRFSPQTRYALYRFHEEKAPCTIPLTDFISYGERVYGAISASINILKRIKSLINTHRLWKADTAGRVTAMDWVNLSDRVLLTLGVEQEHKTEKEKCRLGIQFDMFVSELSCLDLNYAEKIENLVKSASAGSANDILLRRFSRSVTGIRGLGPCANNILQLWVHKRNYFLQLRTLGFTRDSVVYNNLLAEGGGTLNFENIEFSHSKKRGPIRLIYKAKQTSARALTLTGCSGTLQIENLPRGSILTVRDSTELHLTLVNARDCQHSVVYGSIKTFVCKDSSMTELYFSDALAERVFLSNTRIASLTIHNSNLRQLQLAASMIDITTRNNTTLGELCVSDCMGSFSINSSTVDNSVFKNSLIQLLSFDSIYSQIDLYNSQCFGYFLRCTLPESALSSVAGIMSERIESNGRGVAIISAPSITNRKVQYNTEQLRAIVARRANQQSNWKPLACLLTQHDIRILFERTKTAFINAHMTIQKHGTMRAVYLAMMESASLILLIMRIDPLQSSWWGLQSKTAIFTQNEELNQLLQRALFSKNIILYLKQRHHINPKLASLATQTLLPLGRSLVGRVTYTPRIQNKEPTSTNVISALSGEVITQTSRIQQTRALHLKERIQQWKHKDWLSFLSFQAYLINSYSPLRFRINTQRALRRLKSLIARLAPCPTTTLYEQLEQYQATITNLKNEEFERAVRLDQSLAMLFEISQIMTIRTHYTMLLAIQIQHEFKSLVRRLKAEGSPAMADQLQSWHENNLAEQGNIASALALTQHTKMLSMCPDQSLAVKAEFAKLSDSQAATYLTEAFSDSEQMRLGSQFCLKIASSYRPVFGFIGNGRKKLLAIRAIISVLNSDLPARTQHQIVYRYLSIITGKGYAKGVPQPIARGRRVFSSRSRPGRGFRQTVKHMRYFMGQPSQPLPFSPTRAGEKIDQLILICPTIKQPP